MKNYRPVSNLPFLSKILERVVSAQMQEYLDENELHNDLQSAYRKYHSTETALIRVQNDLLRAVDENKEAVLILLDLSAAFDTIDHELMLARLTDRYGVTGIPHKWFKSYLCDRDQSVVIGQTLSQKHSLIYGVPQGSVIGPIQFILYSGPIQDILKAHGIEGMVYADDTQLYKVFDPPSQAEAIASIEACVTDIRSWATSNKLKINDAKTEIVYIRSRFHNDRAIPSVKIGNSDIRPVDGVRDLGVFIDGQLMMSDHIKNVCRMALISLRTLGQLRKYLDRSTTERLVHAFISSRLDSCNCLLYGLPDTDILKLQRVQNSAARLVTGARRWDHVTPILKDLHWLPIRKRILFKLLLVVYKSLHNLAPTYIKQLITPYHPSRTLRSRSKGLLQVPRAARSAKRTYGSRAFFIAAPKEWNALPEHVRRATSVQSFKTSLKTYLFNL